MLAPNVQLWFIADRCLSITSGVLKDRLRVSGPGGKGLQYEQALPAKGEWTVPVGDRTYRVVRTQALMGTQTVVLSGKNEPVPAQAQRIEWRQAPEGSQCAAHSGSPAAYACARCGTFVCAACESADLVHCRACIGLSLASSEKRSKEVVYYAPAIVFMMMGGALGGLLGALGGAAAAALARKTESAFLKVAAAVGAYSVAGALWLVVATFIRR